MAASFCMQCGAALPGGAQFCAGCGAPVVGGGPTPSPSSVDLTGPAKPPGSPTPSYPAAPSFSGAAGPPLGEVLGVQGTRKFLVQHLLVGPAHSYRVMDHEKHHLFNVGENIRQERVERWNQFMRPAQNGMHVYWGAPGGARGTWGIDDPGGGLHGSLGLAWESGTTVATLVDANGSVQMVVRVKRGLESITANATTADGRPLLEMHAGSMHHNFALHDGSGAEVAKIHESYVSARDTYAVELVGTVDAVQAVVCAILIDHFKGK